MALSLLTQIVINLFPASIVLSAVNCCFVVKVFVSLNYIWNVNHLCLFKEFSGQHFASDIVLWYKQHDLTFSLSFSILRKKNQNCQKKKPHLFELCSLYKLYTPALYRAPSLSSGSQVTYQLISLLWAWLTEGFWLKDQRFKDSPFIPLCQQPTQRFTLTFTIFSEDRD